MKIIALQRDGLVTYSPMQGSLSAGESRPLQEALKAIAAMNQGGYRVALLVQPPLPRGETLVVLNKQHRSLLLEVEEAGGQIDAIFFCPHDQTDTCDCYSLQFGLITQVCQRYHVEPAELTVVGTQTELLASANALGSQSIFISTHESPSDDPITNLPDSTQRFTDLFGYVDYLLDDEPSA